MIVLKIRYIFGKWGSSIAVLRLLKSIISSIYRKILPTSKNNRITTIKQNCFSIHTQLYRALSLFDSYPLFLSL